MSMDSLTLTSSTGRFVREAHYLAPPSPARKLAVFLDAEYYVERMDAPGIVKVHWPRWRMSTPA